MIKRLVSETFQDKAYRAIKESIVRNELLPGESLSIEDLAQQLGVSQTPIREALTRLSAEGLVEREPNRTAVVSTLELQDIHQAYQVRKLLEPYAAKMVAEDLEAQPELRSDLTQLKRAATELQAVLSPGVVSLDPSAYESCQDIDLQLHELMLDALGDSLFGRALSLVGNYSLRMRSLAILGLHAQDLTTLRAILNQHIEMIDAILAGRGEEIVETVTSHLASAEMRTIDAVKKAGKSIRPDESWENAVASVRSQQPTDPARPEEP